MIISNIFPFEVLHFGKAKDVPVQNALKGFFEKYDPLLMWLDTGIFDAHVTLPLRFSEQDYSVLLDF